MRALFLGILTILAAFGITYGYTKYNQATVIITPDPYDSSLIPTCPTEFDTFNTTSYPPPVSRPAKLNMQAKYPSSKNFPPLIGDTQVVVQYDYEKGSFVGSPSVLKLNGTWIASFDVKIYPHINTAESWETQIWLSTDDAKTWVYKATVKGVTWGSLFTVNNEIYLLGSGQENKRIVISRMISISEWTEPAIILNRFKEIHTGNVGVLVTEDKVQTCIKNGRKNGDVLILYAFHKKDNLMKSWRVSNVATEKLKTSNLVHALFNLEFDRVRAEEGVLVPYGNKYAQVIMRVNNDQICSLSERYLWNLETNQFSFMKLSIDPGWSAAHGFVIYDPVSEFYWMASNYARDTKRNLHNTSLYVPKSGDCAMDRSILALYYNKHLSDSWHLAGFVTYSPDFAHHAAYPFLVQDGDDLVFVARAHLGGPYNETTVNHGKRVCAPFGFENVDATSNNHNSNMVIFSRITNFRKYIHPMMWYGQRTTNPWVK